MSTSASPPIGPLATDDAPGTPLDVLAGPRETLGRRVLAQGVRDVAYLLLGLPLGVLVFTLLVTLVSTAGGLLLLVVGVPALVASLEVARWCADLERGRTRIVDPRPIPRAYRPWRWELAQMGRVLADPRRWLDLLYGVVQLPVSVLAFAVAATAWSAALGLVLAPLLLVVGAEVTIVRPVEGVGGALLSTLLGVALVPVAFGLCRGAAWAQAALARVALGDGRERLAARVTELESTRSGAVNAADGELRRIERDLHDGAQARMVSVGMGLGLARERLADDPEGAAALIDEARAETRTALGEMRDLVRGIAPTVLTDRGLDAALSALVARSPVPVEVRVDLDERPRVAVEAAAYYVVAESLANVAKHAGARSATVEVERTGDGVRVTVCDDGRGGAVTVPGGGLGGLRERVAALDGTLMLESPVGGPTVLIAEVPCGS